MNPSSEQQPLRIVHVLRAPLGGLFRHVVDLARQQIKRGHLVGLVTDSTTGGQRAHEVLGFLRPQLALGVTRLPMHRLPHPTDITTFASIRRELARLKPDIVHGHGAKGGAYARLPGLFASQGGPIRAYTPHGGSFNYKPGTRAHRVFMGVESVLNRATDLLLFESAYIAGRHEAYVGQGRALSRVIVNGVSDSEFIPIEANADAADLLYVGELRSAKGIDTLIDALALINKGLGRPASLVLVGSGPDESELAARAAADGVATQIRFAGAMPAREAFKLGRVLVVPSRAESLPYVVLEAAAARVPMVATNVGGIPEIFGPYAGRLIPCDSAPILASAILDQLRAAPAMRIKQAATLAGFVGSRFTLAAMADGVLEGYREALALRDGAAIPGAHYATHST